MIDQIRQLTEQYHNWMSESTTLRTVENGVEITTPFLDRHNDMMQVYAELSGDEIILTDDGYTIDDLEFCGLTVDSASCRKLLQLNLNGFAVKREGNELVTRVTAKDFAVKLHNLLQAMIAVDDLHYIASPSQVKRRFDADIASWLNASNIQFGKKKFKGRSGYYVDYQHVIPPSANMHYRMLIGINNPRRGAVEQAAFRWLDIHASRPRDARLYPILNDAQQDSVLSEMDAFRNLEINPILWSERESVRDELAS
ncbi:MAG: DUF1828 domain-containing protein [Chloroflexi bacterium]|nr:DUF1828 domain-containing protein [Chloroflexota bacterium]